ncbi:Charged multivesicular body protein 5 [Triticum urartu]|uniref:Charged multivesicular body protein 5 n=1 Tax=Triticum urartu TaxID=4572 RepID=M7YM97_TRIUA|nr:Charged multivesicular body protein 5 [Triticum urartu]
MAVWAGAHAHALAPRTRATAGSDDFAHDDFFPDLGNLILDDMGDNINAGGAAPAAPSIRPISRAEEEGATKKIFGAKKSQDPPPSIQDATDRIYKRGDTVYEKIKKLDAELARYKEQIKKTRPGPAQEAVKARAMRILNQRKI